MLTRLNAAWRAFNNTPSQANTTKGYSPYSYDAFNLFGGGTNDGQLAATTWGATLAYYKIPAVKSSIDVIAENAASVPIVELDADGNEVARSDENPQDSAIITAIHESYNYHGIPLIQEWVSASLLYGMNFVQLVQNDYRFVRGLRWLNPNAMSINSTSGRIDSFYYGAYDTDVPSVLQPNQVVYSREFNPGDDIYGYSPTLNVISKVNITLNFDRFTIAYHRNGGQLGMAVSFKEAVGIDEAQKLADFWRRTFRGVDSFFKTQISHIPLDYQQFEPIDISRPLAVSQDAERAVYMGYRVPPEMLGDTRNNPYQFSAEKKNAFMQTVVKPQLDSVAMALNTKAMKHFAPAGHSLSFDFSAFKNVSENDKMRAEIALNAYNEGAITLNEYRVETGRDKVSNGDVYKVASGVVYVPAPNLISATQPQPESTASYQWQLPDGDSETKAAPANTTFSSVTYNGVTVQASPVRPSSRDDKKYMRYVRYKGDERLVHWGEPNEQMERDNPEAREAFNSRHSCDTKRDPFTAGFWACWAWQPSADVRSVDHAKSCTCGHCSTDTNSHDLPTIETWDYSPSKALSELIIWQRFVKQDKQRDFEPHYLRGHYADTISTALATSDTDAITTAFDSCFSQVKSSGTDALQTAFMSVIDALLTSDNPEDAIKSIQAIRLDFEMRFDDVLAAIRDGGIDNRRRAGNILRQIIRVFGARAYRQGLVDGGVFDDPSDDEQAEINSLIAEQSKYVSNLTQVLIKEDGITDAQARDKAAMWFNKSIQVFYAAGLLSANKNGLYEWVIGPTEESCRDCIRLNGQKHRLRHWKARYMPQDDKLSCRGFNCKCRLVPTTGKAQGKF